MAPSRAAAPVMDVAGADTAGDEAASCLASAEAQILQVPDKDELHVTTSKSFKRDLARFFCQRSPSRATALEVGIYRGHTTALLAAIFARVFAVDVESQYLRAAAETCGDRQGSVVFLGLDSYTDSWHTLSSNSIHAALIDGDHRYERVRSDARRALGLLSPLEYVAFDDYGVEPGVRRTVAELVEEGKLRECEPLGRGSDGEPWPLRGWKMVNHSEGIVCRRGNDAPGASAAGLHVASSSSSSPGVSAELGVDFQEVPFLLYPQPFDHLMRAVAVWTFWHNGSLWTTTHGRGRWHWLSEAAAARAVAAGSAAGKEVRLQGSLLGVAVPGLPPGEWDVLLNRPRSAFLLTPTGGSLSRWMGLRVDRLTHVFDVANEQFDIG